LTRNGVSWNNNNAENAIRAFAELRRVIGGTCTEKGLREYLVLLSICETCKRRGIKFLDFILSEETSIEKLVTGRSSHSMTTPDADRQGTKAKPKVATGGSNLQKSEFPVPDQVSLERRDDCHPMEVVKEGGACSRKENTDSDTQNTEVVRMLNGQCMVKTQDGHRVVVASGIVLAEYGLGDRVGEAYAMVRLVEQGLADQNDVARAFGCSARTVRRYQRRFEDGGLAALGHGSGNSRKKRRRLVNPRRQLVQHLKTQGCSDPEIARRIGVSEKTVRNVLRRLGLQGGT
jgi:transposase